MNAFSIALLVSASEAGLLSIVASENTISSEALFNGLYEIGINHGGSLYRLKITRQGKLILNK